MRDSIVESRVFIPVSIATKSIGLTLLKKHQSYCQEKGDTFLWLTVYNRALDLFYCCCCVWQSRTSMTSWCPSPWR